MSLRTAALVRLQHAVQHGYWQHCSEPLYRLMYGTPADRQISIATSSMKQYLPIFKRRWPDVGWAQLILENPTGWVAEHQREVPDDLEVTHPADSIFMFGIDAVLVAAAYPSLDGVLTAAAVCATKQGVEALANNAWADSDPEAVAIFREISESDDPSTLSRLVKEFSTRSATANSAANAARIRLWNHIREYVDALDFQLFPDPSPNRLESDFQIWLEKEMLIVLPGRENS